MASRQQHRSSCPISCSLEFLGDRWSLLILRDVLFSGQSRYSGLAAQEGIATNILADRLAKLELGGLITKHNDPEDGRKKVYRPTAAALELIPALVELIVWGSKHTGGEPNEIIVARHSDDRQQLLCDLKAYAMRWQDAAQS